MANPEHLKTLKQGVEIWNRWRQENPDISPDLSHADLHQSHLYKANLTRANLSSAYVADSDLRNADLTEAALGSADLDHASLYEARLRKSDLRSASLFWTIVNRADLSAADLSDAFLQSAQLVGANLSGSSLRGCQLWGTVFDNAALDGSDFSTAVALGTIFGNNDLSKVKGLESVHHDGPSIIGIETIYRSKGNIPESFLRGCGVPEEFIVYMRSLVGTAIEFYSCFISYSSKDNDFAQRLHADLQQKGVRCWFAPEDLKIGDKFRTRIDESIRIYDKLMVILSENSIRSTWVDDEVEAALEKERKQTKLVLFPIRLDDAVMETDQAWAASLRRTRHIGDFRAWKDHDQYQKSFERLLRDLKA